MSAYLDDAAKLLDFSNSNQNYNNFAVNLVQDKYYTFYGTWRHYYSTYDFSVAWSYGSQGQQLIPNSNVFLPTLVGSSPYTINVVANVWGDGKRTGSETWDDNNSSSGDGWSATCSIETGWTCSGGTSTTPDSWSEYWGDGKRFNSLSTYWDDGNTSNGDGCSSTWSVEIGFTWSGGSSTAPDVWSDSCGDGKHYSSLATFWDDGNTSNGDGCSLSCSIESGWTWSGGTTSTKDTWSEIWGDSKRFNTFSTYWDDGNTSNNDGCNSSWLIEAGWNWSGGSSTTKDTWTEIWGDSKRFNTISTYWDDGNILSSDGSNATWQVEIGWTWSGGTTSSQDTWTEVWGDGRRSNSLSTYWDDGNTSNKDGCNSLWLIEAGWNWSGGSSTTKDTWTEIWGDGIKFNILTTYCDDANTLNGDGCNSSWNAESGWKWTGGSTTSADSWYDICGDGINMTPLSSNWDDGNLLNNDGWNTNCKVEVGRNCSGGSKTSIDIWKEIWGDGIILYLKYIKSFYYNLLNRYFTIFSILKKKLEIYDFC